MGGEVQDARCAKRAVPDSLLDHPFGCVGAEHQRTGIGAEARCDGAELGGGFGERLKPANRGDVDDVSTEESRKAPPPPACGWRGDGKRGLDGGQPVASQARRSSPSNPVTSGFPRPRYGCDAVLGLARWRSAFSAETDGRIVIGWRLASQAALR